MYLFVVHIFHHFQTLFISKTRKLIYFISFIQTYVKHSSTGQIIIICDLNTRLDTSKESFSYIYDNSDEQDIIDNIDFLPM